MSNWVEELNANPPPIVAHIAEAPFEPGALCAEAAAVLGRDPDSPGLFGNGDFREPLSVLCGALESEANLTVLGRWITHRFLQRLLQVRIQLADLVGDDPSLTAEAIERPIVILGPPRSGTTRVHALFAADLAHRAPRGWELLRPVPPLAPDEDVAPRRRLAQAELALPQAMGTGLSAIHHYDADMYKECLSAMSFSFRSEEFVSRYRVPSYVSWLQSCDMAPAYEMHRLVLQVLQRRQPTRRWVLKSPVHLQSIGVLMATYPDALLVVTHRDPQTVLGSVTDLVATLRGVHSDSVDRDEIAGYHLDLYRRSLNGLHDALADVETVAHCMFDDLVGDEVETLRGVYTDLGLDFTQEANDAMVGYVAQHPPDEHGRHSYERPVPTDDFAPYLSAMPE